MVAMIFSTILHHQYSQNHKIVLLCELYRKIHYLKREFHVKFHAKSQYSTSREAMSAISVFQVKFNMELTSQVIDFP